MPMRIWTPSRRWLVAGGIAVTLALLVAVLVWPLMIRHVILSRLEAMTNRRASVETVALNPLTGRLGLRGFRLLEPAGSTPFFDIERLEARARPLSLLRGHLWLRHVVLQGSTVHVVRLREGFNFTDLIQSSGSGGRLLDVTVDRFVVTRGTVQMEDRALAEPRTWTSEGIEIEAHDLSTRRDDGRAVARSVTAGAEVSLEIRRVRLYPIHLEAVVTTSGFDLALARIYLPPGAPIVERGRASTRLEVALDAREGLRAQATGEVVDLAVVEPGQREPALLVPKLAVRLDDFLFRDDRLRVGGFELAGSGSVRDPVGPTRRRETTLRARIADVTWPITGPGQLDVEGRVQGAGLVKLTGSLRPPPAASQLRLRMAGVDLAPWARLFPIGVRVEGFGDADLSLDEALAPGVPSRLRGTAALSRAGLWDASRRLAGVDRVEATGLEIEWPARIAVRRLAVTGPRVTIERDRSGGFPGLGLLGPAPVGGPTAPALPQSPALAGAPLGLALGEIIVTGGAVAWRDEAVTPAVALDVTEIEARVTGVAWPLRGPLAVRAVARPPGGGEVQVSGRVGIEPLTADLQVTARDAEIGPYRRYVSTAARVAGRADLDLRASLAPAAAGAGERAARLRGRATLTGIDVRDGQRTILKLERAAATGLDLEWPRRALVEELRLEGPWVLLERERTGVLGFRTLLGPGPGVVAPPAGPGGETRAAATPPASDGGRVMSGTIRTLLVEEGGARVVDQQVEPPFAVDVSRLTVRIEGLSNDPAARPARLELTGRAATTSVVALSGTVGSLGGPLRLEMAGDLRDFAVPRTNPYLVERVAWEARDGWLGTTFRVRVDGDALDARTDVRLSRLEVARAGAHDEAQARIGLPLGMIVALMKDSRGEIRVSLPVGGKLSDPRFDLSEAIWTTLRNVAVKAITAPVSWIGRVHVGADSRIQRIDVDPVAFAPGRATLTPETQEQVVRVAAFLEQAPAVRLALTPVLSPRDRAALWQGTLEAAIERAAREQRVSPEDALARLFRERFSRQPVPATAEATRAALAAAEQVTAADLAGLATRRLAAVRDGLRRAGIDGGRLLEVTAPAAVADSPEGQVRLDLLEPESPRPPGRSSAVRPVAGGGSPPTGPGR